MPATETTHIRTTISTVFTTRPLSMVMRARCWPPTVSHGTFEQAPKNHLGACSNVPWETVGGQQRALITMERGLVVKTVLIVVLMCVVSVAGIAQTLDALDAVSYTHLT